MTSAIASADLPAARNSLVSRSVLLRFSASFHISKATPAASRAVGPPTNAAVRPRRDMPPSNPPTADIAELKAVCIAPTTFITFPTPDRTGPSAAVRARKTTIAFWAPSGRSENPLAMPATRPRRPATIGAIWSPNSTIAACISPQARAFSAPMDSAQVEKALSAVPAESASWPKISRLRSTFWPVNARPARTACWSSRNFVNPLSPRRSRSASRVPRRPSSAIIWRRSPVDSPTAASASSACWDGFRIFDNRLVSCVVEVAASLPASESDAMAAPTSWKVTPSSAATGRTRPIWAASSAGSALPARAVATITSVASAADRPDLA